MKDHPPIVRLLVPVLHLFGIVAADVVQDDVQFTGWVDGSKWFMKAMNSFERWRSSMLGMTRPAWTSRAAYSWTVPFRL